MIFLPPRIVDWCTSSHPMQHFMDVLRVAIAVSALQHKPADQSYEAYVLDLQYIYPCNRAPGSEGWKERALALEVELRELQVKYDGEHIELETFRREKERPPSGTTAEVKPESKKKQQKKKTARSAEPAFAAPAHRKVVLRTILDPQHDVALPSLSSSSDILTAFDTLDRLLFLYPSNTSADSTNLVLAAAKRAVDALGDNLARLLPPNEVPVPSSAGDTLASLGTLMERLMLTVLPIFTKCGRKQSRNNKVIAEWNDIALYELLGGITGVLLLPLVRSFAPLSTDYLSALLRARKKTQKPSTESSVGSAPLPTDIRPDAFAMLDKIVTTLESFSASVVVGPHPLVRRIKHVVIIETARELHDLYEGSRPFTPSDKGVPSSAPPRSGRTRGSADRASANPRRLALLARKDALWYLCSTLQRVLALGIQPSTGDSPPGVAPRTGGEQDELLEETLYEMLASLLRNPTTHGRTPPAAADGVGAAHEGCPGRPSYGRGLSEVERGMVLAVVERAWLGG